MTWPEILWCLRKVFREKCSEKVEGVPRKDVLSVDCGKSEQVDEIDMVEPDGELDNIFAQPVAVGELFF